MAFYSPNNQYLLPRPQLLGQGASKFTEYFVKGCIYGGIFSALYCNPMGRAIKFTVGWGLVWGLGFTRPLYNSPGYCKRTDTFKPLLDRDDDWMTTNQIKTHFPMPQLVSHTP